MVLLPAVESGPLSARGFSSRAGEAADAHADRAELAGGNTSSAGGDATFTGKKSARESAREEVRMLKQVIRIQQKRIEELQKAQASGDKSQSPRPRALHSDSEEDGTCPKCGNIYMADAIFCRHCGEKREAYKHLPHSSGVSPRGKRGGVVQQGLLEQVQRLTGEARQLRQDNKELRRVNRRLRDMLSQDDRKAPVAAVGEAPAEAEVASALHATSPLPARKQSSFRGEMRRSTAYREKASKRISQELLAGNLPKILREVSVRGVFKHLFDGLKQMERITPGVLYTLYAFDPLLRRLLNEGDGESKNAGDVVFDRPHHFYLGGGALTIAAYRKDGLKPEAPQFSDLTQLPVKQRTCVVLPLQGGNYVSAPLAALQVTFAQDDDDSILRESRHSDHSPTVAEQFKSLSPRSRALSEDSETGMVPNDEHKGASSNRWSETEMLLVEILCQAAAQALHWQCHGVKMQVYQERAEKSFAMLAQVAGCSNVSTFEHLLRLNMMEIFKATSMRISWYDSSGSGDAIVNIAIPESQVKHGKASMKPAGVVGVRHVTRTKLASDGIVARCARHRQVIRIDRMSDWHVVDIVADGVDPSVNHADSMLAGPLLVDSSQGADYAIGTMQLLAKGGGTKKHAWGAFSLEDEILFTQLTKIVGMEAFHAIQAQVTHPPAQIDSERLMAAVLT
eukprot:TRINITY_DN27495_c0_g1_i2.p1 TRINITY_DN27495_c0_g1~~TRINITY_DN27495_c0_g1_i2.p1  ORF type:complete len:679 (-),score=117.08 TRINITY_DN27495_c0_g1_i2:38-2074(-)